MVTRLQEIKIRVEFDTNHYTKRETFYYEDYEDFTEMLKAVQAWIDYHMEDIDG